MARLKGETLNIKKDSIRLVIIAFILLVLAYALTTRVFGQETILDVEQQMNVYLIEYYAKYYHVDVNFCKGIGWIESKYYSNAFYNAKTPWENEYWISRGVMQVQLDTARKYYPRVKPDDLFTEIGIKAGIREIKYLMKKYPYYTKEEIAQLYNSGEEQFFDLEKPVRSQKYVRILHKAYKRFGFEDNLAQIPKGREVEYRAKVQEDEMRRNIQALQKPQKEIEVIVADEQGDEDLPLGGFY
jgi:Transglycosylase SLT domain